MSIKKIVIKKKMDLVLIKCICYGNDLDFNEVIEELRTKKKYIFYRLDFNK